MELLRCASVIPGLALPARSQTKLRYRTTRGCRRATSQADSALRPGRSAKRRKGAPGRGGCIRGSPKITSQVSRASPRTHGPRPRTAAQMASRGSACCWWYRPYRDGLRPSPARGTTTCGTWRAHRSRTERTHLVETVAVVARFSQEPGEVRTDLVLDEPASHSHSTIV